ncbi:MAG: hypothetical protein RIB03_07360 [Henriciella sp.]|uniref:hypothetical protein n=1 Tax=Henriciella sp. TaxID=1968823 RepID=UPI0032ED0857
MKLAITTLLAGTSLFLGACASAPQSSGIGSDIEASAVEYGDLSSHWKRAYLDEQKGLDLQKDAEKRIREATKDIRSAEKKLERGQDQLRRGERAAAAGKAERLGIEAEYRDAVQKALPGERAD